MHEIEINELIKKYKTATFFKVGFDEMSYVIDKTVDIFFDGTDGIKEWINDFFAGDLKQNEEDYHKGVSEIYDKYIKKNIDSLLKHYPDKLLRVFGFSRGAWFAAYTAIQLVKAGKTVKLLLVAPPRLGNSLLRPWYNRIDGYILKHRADPVPSLPPKSLGFDDYPFITQSTGKRSDIWKIWNWKKYHKYYLT